MEPHEAIRNLLARYILRLDEHNVDALTSFYARDGKMVNAGSELVGQQAIHDYLDQLFGSYPAGRETKHLNGSPVITLHSETTAECVSDIVMLQSFPDLPWAVRLTNRHHDWLVVEDGEWKIAEKRIEDVHAFRVNQARFSE